MDGMAVLLLIVAGLALLGTTAAWFGADTRPGFDDRPATDTAT